MHRKKWAYVPPAPPQGFNSDTRIAHPTHGGESFGRVPEIQVRKGPLFPAGDIILTYGQHQGPNKGFGFQHIWTEHFKAETDHNNAMSAVVAFVAKICAPRTPIYYEHGKRVAVFRGSAGQVLVEVRGGTTPFYSVVTAFKPRNPIGEKIGALAFPETPKAPDREPLE